MGVLPVTSTNALGTTFTVSDLGTAFQIAGGAGQDTIIASGFTFSADQRATIFATASVEKIVDASGTYGVDIPPTITSNGGGDTAAISIAENTTAVTIVTASDPDAGQTLSYSISGGADASKFTIIANTGALSFVTAPNFEAPGDAGHNNVYEVTVRVLDSYGGIDTQALSVSVQNVSDGNANILWQNNNGTPAVWLMSGLIPNHGAALPNPGPSWQIKGTGDFDGDSISDILWQGTDGTPARDIRPPECRDCPVDIRPVDILPQRQHIRVARPTLRRSTRSKGSRRSIMLLKPVFPLAIHPGSVPAARPF